MSIVEDAMRQMPSTNEVLSKKAHEELLAYCNKSYNICRQARLPFERQWYLNMAFYFGRQYAEWATSAVGNDPLTEASFAKLMEPAAPKWRVRLVCNKIRPIIRGELAKITKEKPRGYVVPTSTDDNDLAGARAAEAIQEAIWRDLHMNRVYRRSCLWMLFCGTSFVKDWYDKGIEDVYGVKGAIQAEHVTPFHLFVPDIQEEELENQPFVIHALAKDVDWVRSKFPDKNVQPDSSGGAGLLEQRFLGALGITQPSEKRYVAVKEAWYKPNSKYPSGLQVMWAGETILYSQEGWPYKHKEYPFAKLDHVPTGRFYGDSTIIDLIPLQKQYNRGRSQIIEAKNRMAKPQLAAVRGSVDPNKITSEPGLIVFYQPGYAAPTPIPLQNLPGYVMEEIEATLRDIMDSASQHEISKGSVPPGITAATAISFLQEQDDSRLHSTVTSLEEAVEKTSRHFLCHADQFWSMKRKIKTVGENKSFEAIEFSQREIRGNIDFKIEPGSATPTSRAAKQAFITELGKMGWITPDKALRYLDMAEVGRLYEEMQLDNRQADRENIRLANGEEFGSNRHDDDASHLISHENYMKSEEYENHDDAAKERFTAHCTTHKMHMAQMQGLQLAPDDPKLDMVARSIMTGQPMPGQPPQPGAAQNGAAQQSGPPA